MPVGTNSPEQRLAALRAQYLSSLPETLATLEEQLMAWPAGHSVPKELHRKVHSLKGSAGGYGLKFVTMVCHRMEESINRGSPTGDHALHVDALLQHVDLIADYTASVASGGNSETDFLARLDDLESGRSKRRTRVLIVESGLSMRRAFRRLLGSRGVATSASGSGYEALGQLLRGHYDALLTSYETEDISGLSLAKAARACDEISDDLIVILVTSNEIEEFTRAVNHVVRKDRDLETSLIDALRSADLIR